MRLLCGLLTLVLISCRSEDATQIRAENVVAFLAPGEERAAVVFMRLVNGSEQLRALIGAHAAPPLKAKLLTIEYAEGAFRTVPVEELWMPPGRDLRLRGGGVHVRLEGPIHVGTPLRFELEFGDRTRKPVEVAVKTWTPRSASE